MTVPYTDSSRVGAYLGVTLTGDQETQAGLLADAATEWIDRYTGRSWQTASPVSGEVQTVLGDRVYLAHRPVSSITTVETRSTYIGAAYTTLAASQYELLDGDAGLLQIVGWGDYLARIAYVHTGSVPPADVALAATMIAAGWLNQALRPNTGGIDSLSLGQNDIAIKFSASRSDVPSEARSILDGYRVTVIA